MIYISLIPLLCLIVYFVLSFLMLSQPYSTLISGVVELNLDLSNEIQEKLIKEAKLYFPKEHGWCIKNNKVEDAIVFYADEKRIWFLCLGGKEVHSHPSGPPVPSKTDIVFYSSRLPFFHNNEFYIIGKDFFNDRNWIIKRWKIKQRKTEENR